MGFNFKHYLKSVFGTFAYSFISSIVLGVFVVLIWSAFRFINLGVSFFENRRWELSVVGLIGAFEGFCIGFVKSIHENKDKN